MTSRTNWVALLLCRFIPLSLLSADPPGLSVSFCQSAQTVDAYDFVEVTPAVASHDIKNPFTDAAVDGHRNGIVRVDPKYPWHFIWEGTGQHYYWNGTTLFF